VGIDPWKEAAKRAKSRIRALQLDNISIVEGDAQKKSNFFDLLYTGKL